MDAVYYYMPDLDMVGKEEGFIPYIYDKRNGWIIDQFNVLTDRIVGYDGSEPKDSPYKIGNSDMMDSIREISKTEALKMIEGGEINDWETIDIKIEDIEKVLQSSEE